MAEKDNSKTIKDFKENTPFYNELYNIRGSHNLDWGMKNRLSSIFKKDGKTVMLAFDHGYIMGPTSGLERLDLNIKDIISEVDCLMGTRGAFRTSISPTINKGIALRASAGSTVLRDDISKEILGVDIEDAIRINASCLAIQTFIGTENETISINNLCQAVDLGNKYGIPVLGVVAVGKEMERTTEYFLLATRVLAELGAHIIKTYYCEDFKKVVAACPVPIVIAGGKKLPEKEALELAYNAINDGACGVDMGRNIFQAENPKAMAHAIRMIVHDNATVDEAYNYYMEEK